MPVHPFHAYKPMIEQWIATDPNIANSEILRRVQEKGAKINRQSFHYFLKQWDLRQWGTAHWDDYHAQLKSLIEDNPFITPAALHIAIFKGARVHPTEKIAAYLKRSGLNSLRLTPEKFEAFVQTVCEQNPSYTIKKIVEQVQKVFPVGAARIEKVVRKVRPRKRRGKVGIAQKNKDKIISLRRSNPNITFEELAAMLSKIGIPTSASTLLRVLNEWGLHTTVKRTNYCRFSLDIHKEFIEAQFRRTPYPTLTKVIQKLRDKNIHTTHGTLIKYLRKWGIHDKIVANR